MRRWAFVVLAVVLAFSGLACSGSSKLGKDQGRLTVTGEAFVSRPGKAAKPSGRTRVLRPGDQVEVRRGEARVDLAGGGRLEVLAPVSFRFESRPFLQSGEMLVVPDARALAVATDDAGVTVDSGATRLSRTLALTVTTYRGRSTVTSPGSEPLAVRAPRRATVAGRGALPGDADAIPYTPSSTDRWDQRYLAEPFAMGEQLERDSEGLAAQLPPGEGRSGAFLRTLFPVLEQNGELESVLDPALPPSENVVGAAIAIRSVSGTFADRWREIFSFRDFGDPSSHANVNWGLVAIDVGVDNVSLVTADVERALGRAPKQFAVAQVMQTEPATTPTTLSFMGDGSATTTSQSPRTTSTTARPPGPTTSTTAPPVPPVTTPTTVPLPVPTTTPVPTTVVVPTTIPPTGTPIDRVVDPLIDTITSLLPRPGSTAEK